MYKIILVFIFMGLLVSACNEYPGHKYEDGVKMTLNPKWGDAIEQDITNSSECHLDSINDKSGDDPLTHIVKRSKSALNVTGWNAISMKNGILATDMAITLKSKSPHGGRFFATTMRIKRPDVGEYFKNPAIVDTGFSVIVDLSEVPGGEYVLEVVQHKDGKNFKCQHTGDIFIEDEFNQYQEHKNDVKMTLKPIWGEVIEQNIIPGGECHLESINAKSADTPLTHTLEQGKSALKVVGWSVISVKEGIVATDIAITLKSKSSQGGRLFATASRKKRPDVVEYFNNQSIVDTGFTVNIDLSDVPGGEYVLEVIQHKDGKNFKCQQTANIFVQADDSLLSRISRIIH